MCRVQSTKNEEKRPTLFPLFLFAGTSLVVLSSLEKCSLSPRVVFAEEIVSDDGAVPILSFFSLSFLPALLYRLSRIRIVSFSTVEVYTLRLFNPEKGNVESIFLNRE